MYSCGFNNHGQLGTRLRPQQGPADLCEDAGELRLSGDLWKVRTINTAARHFGGSKFCDFVCFFS